MSTVKPGRLSRKKPPKKAGLYRWVCRETGDVDYIGETCDLARWMLEHARSKKPVSKDTHHFEWKKADGRSTSRTRRLDEKRWIARHSPKLNGNGGGGGRRK